MEKIILITLVSFGIGAVWGMFVWACWKRQYPEWFRCGACGLYFNDLGDTSSFRPFEEQPVQFMTCETCAKIARDESTRKHNA